MDKEKAMTKTEARYVTEDDDREWLLAEACKQERVVSVERSTDISATVAGWQIVTLPVCSTRRYYSVSEDAVRNRDALAVRDVFRCACCNGPQSSGPNARLCLVHYGAGTRERRICQGCYEAAEATSNEQSIRVRDRLEGREVCLYCGAKSEPPRCAACCTGGVKSRNHGLPEHSSDVVMLDVSGSNTITITDDAPTTGTIRYPSGVMCIKHGSQQRAAYSKECAECERELATLIESYIRLGLHFSATRESLIERLEKGYGYGKCSCVVCQLIANAPWPEPEAASRVDHWGSVCAEIGTGLAGLCTGLMTAGDHDADFPRAHECPCCGGDVEGGK
jgi:hypothetical protein